jgi:hypothetical protein
MINSIIEQSADVGQANVRPALRISGNTEPGGQFDGAMLSNCKIKNNHGDNVQLVGCSAVMIHGSEFYTTGTSQTNILCDSGSGHMIIGNHFQGAGTNNFGVRSTNTSVGNIVLGNTINGQSAAGFTGVSFESGSTLGQCKSNLIYSCGTVLSDAAGGTGVDIVTADSAMGGLYRPPVTLAATRAAAFSQVGVGYVSTDVTSGIPYFRGQDDWTPMRGQNRIVLSADRTNNNGVANTMQDVTGLSFTATSGATYAFRAVVNYTAAATTTGSRWAINGPAVSALQYRSENSLTTTTRTTNDGLNGYDLPAASNASSAATAANVAIVEGVLTASATGTVVVRFASEVAASAIVAVAGVSYLEWARIS